jgi:hypothetical protein
MKKTFMSKTEQQPITHGKTSSIQPNFKLLLVAQKPRHTSESYIQYFLKKKDLNSSLLSLIQLFSSRYYTKLHHVPPLFSFTAK